MRSRRAIRLLLWLAVLAIVLPTGVAAQDDPDEVPLGDVARSIRKAAPATGGPVIDDDNLPQVMELANRPHDFGSSLRFVMAGNSKGFQVQAPDVTCSLSFSANVKSLLSAQYDQMQLPASELAKVEAKAVIEGDALTVPLFNGTQWHLSELAVALTVVKKDGSGLGTIDAAGDPFEQVRPEKRPDRTVIYRMRAAGGPWQRAVFSAPLDQELGPDEEWHWAIVQAKGYPPEAYPKPGIPMPMATSAGNGLPTARPVSLTSADGETAKQSLASPQ